MKFQKASRFEPAKFDPESYFKRTCRNHFWIGGPEGQERIRNLRIGIAGLGGMGSNILEQLVRLGVGHVRVADPDTIEATNLNRQVIANRASLGHTKVDAAIRQVRSIAEDFEIVGYTDGLHEGNAAEFVEGCDLIVDEIDVFPLKAHVVLHRAARAKGLPLYSAYAVGMGIHFYKFQGEGYTFEDFLGGDPSKWDKPTAEFLIEKFGSPAPGYLTPERLQSFDAEISTGGTPIFGPATLLGHSMVVHRLIVDVLASCGIAERVFPRGGVRTPLMPDFLALDLAELTLQEARMPGAARSVPNGRIQRKAAA